MPIFGITSRGVRGYFKTYLEPSAIMLPFNIVSEFSRGVSLAIRLYGNIMSGAVIAAIRLGVAPFFFPVVMDMLSLLTGLIQAYVFAILATVYISSATAEPETSGSAKLLGLLHPGKPGGVSPPNCWTSSSDSRHSRTGSEDSRKSGSAPAAPGHRCPALRRTRDRVDPLRRSLAATRSPACFSSDVCVGHGKAAQPNYCAV